MTQLFWAESQAIHTWRAAGFTPTQIADGMHLSINSVKQEVYFGVRTKRTLEAIPSWSDIDLATCWRRSMRKLMPAEADAVVLWLQLGYEADDIAKAMHMTRDHVMTYLCRNTKASARLNQQQAEKA